MSTTGRVRQRRLAGSQRAADGDAAGRGAPGDAGGRGAPGGAAGRGTSAALAPRAVRVRNVVFRQAAARLGLPVPNDADLAELSAGASLAETVGRWRALHAPDTVPRRTRGRLVLKTVWVTAITVLGLALSYGPAQ